MKTRILLIILVAFFLLTTLISYSFYDYESSLSRSNYVKRNEITEIFNMALQNKSLNSLRDNLVDEDFTILESNQKRLLIIKNKQKIKDYYGLELLFEKGELTNVYFYEP